MNFQSSI